MTKKIFSKNTAKRPHSSISQKGKKSIYVFLNIRDWYYTLISLVEKTHEDMIQHKI